MFVSHGFDLIVNVVKVRIYYRIQFFVWLLETLIRWRNIVLTFSLKVIFRRRIFRVDGKHFILNGSRWKLSQWIMVLFLELYQLFFLFFKTLIIWRNLVLEFSLKVIFRRRMFRVDGRVPRKNVTKTDIYWGLYGIHNFVFLTLLQIFVPCCGILFFTNNYFLVCMFTYCTSPQIISAACSSPRRPLFLHTLSFEWTKNLYINFSTNFQFIFTFK